MSLPPPDCRDWRQAETWNKAHGRLEHREVIVSTELNEWLTASWPGVQQVFCLRRTVEQRGQVRCQTVYGISSLPPRQADARRLLALVRAHWRIENRLHWCRDMTLREDHCQVRKGAAPQVWAALNSLVLAVFDLSLGPKRGPADAALGSPAAAGCPAPARFLAGFYIAACPLC